VRKYPDKFCTLGWFALNDPAQRSRIETWKQRPGMLGFRFTFTAPAHKGWWDDNTLDWFWAAAEKAGTPVGLLAGGHFGTVARVAARHPGLRLLIDHYGRGGGATGAVMFDDLPEMLALARFPNVAIKVSGAPSYSKLPYPFKDMSDPTQRIFDAFGPSRTFWGTDITRMPCSYRECVTMFTDELPWLSGTDKELVMAKALCDWVGWKMAA
jgi:predicted TIM-barrel fold metal-dependent hydrolase